MATQLFEGRDSRTAAGSVVVEATVALEISHRSDGSRAIDAVDPPTVETQSREQGLHLGHIVTAKIRGGVVEQAVSERPRGLDEGGPGVGVATTMRIQSSLSLEIDDGRFGHGAQEPGFSATRGEVTGQDQTALEVPDRLTALADPQFDGVRNSSNSWSIWPLPLAPTIRLRNSPSWKTSRVGILITLKRSATSP